MRQSFELQQHNKYFRRNTSALHNSLLSLGPFLTLFSFGAAFRASPFRASNQAPSPAKAAAMSHEHHHQHGSEAAAGLGEGMDAMPMYFMNTWHTTLWFQSWETTSMTVYLISCVGLLLLAIVHEALSCYRSHYLAGSLGEAGGILQEPLVGVSNPRQQRPRTSSNEKLCASALYMANITTGYMLMLAVMTFNVGYFAAVILGMGLGYYLLFESANKQALNRGDGCHGCT